MERVGGVVCGLIGGMMGGGGLVDWGDDGWW